MISLCRCSRFSWFSLFRGVVNLITVVTPSQKVFLAIPTRIPRRCYVLFLLTKSSPPLDSPLQVFLGLRLSRQVTFEPQLSYHCEQLRRRGVSPPLHFFSLSGPPPETESPSARVWGYSLCVVEMDVSVLSPRVSAAPRLLMIAFSPQAVPGARLTFVKKMLPEFAECFSSGIADRSSVLKEFFQFSSWRSR